MSTQEFEDFEIDYDFSTTKPIEGGAYALVDEGTYKVQVIGLKQDTSKKSNKPMVVVEYLITEDQPTEEAAAFVGQHLWCNYTLSDKAMGRFAQLMIACGAPLDKFRASAIYGQEILVDVIHNEGDQITDAEGNPMPVRTFANICKERSLDADGAAIEAEAPPPPPVTRAPVKPAVAAGTKPVTAARPVTPPPPARTPVKNGTATRRA